MTTRGDRTDPRGPFQMGKLIKGIVLNTHDITDHLMSKEEDGGRQAADEEVIDVDKESADGEEAEQVNAEETGREKEQGVEGEKEAEMEVVVEEETGSRRNFTILLAIIFFSFFI